MAVCVIRRYDRYFPLKERIKPVEKQGDCLPPEILGLLCEKSTNDSQNDRGSVSDRRKMYCREYNLYPLYDGQDGFSEEKLGNGN